MQNAKWTPDRDRIGLLITIVLGVLIALAIGGLAAGLVRWYAAARAHRAIGAKLSTILAAGIDREAVSPCVERRLDALAPFIDQAGESGRLTAIGEFGMPPRGIERPGFAIGADVPITAIADDERHELDVWGRLYTMVGPGRAIAPAEAAALREAIIQARMLDRAIVAHVRAVKKYADQRSIGYDAKAGQAQTAAICQPVGAVPEHYGRSPI